MATWLGGQSQDGQQLLRRCIATRSESSASPFIGTLLDKTSTPFALGFLVFTATVIGVLGCLPYTWAAIANVCLFVIYRPFYYTTVSDYSAKVFGFVTFGKVYGLVICLAGLFNFLQSPLDRCDACCVQAQSNTRQCDLDRHCGHRWDCTRCLHIRSE